ncbi:MAG: HNH endonuclease, partial [Streptomyces sp.]|nr:HNH endonuclease [Streptomyces sp.]
MPHVLVLNASYEPLGVVPLRRALVLVLENKAFSLEESGAFMHSATVTVPAPSVVRLKRFVRVPYRGPVPLTRRALFAR